MLAKADALLSEHTRVHYTFCISRSKSALCQWCMIPSSRLCDQTEERDDLIDQTDIYTHPSRKKRGTSHVGQTSSKIYSGNPFLFFFFLFFSQKLQKDLFNFLLVFFLYFLFFSLSFFFSKFFMLLLWPFLCCCCFFVLVFKKF